MTNIPVNRIIIAVCLFSVSLFIVSAFAATTEYDCVNGGGHVASGSGCTFCVGGKYDLTDIKEARKIDANRPGSDNKTDEKAYSKSRTVTGSKTSADD